MNNFTTWSFLATYAGTVVMVLILTQLTKGLGFLKKIPTQLWSYFLALVILYPATYFTHQLTVDNAVLILFNAAIISLATNGGFAVINRIMNGTNTTDTPATIVNNTINVPSSTEPATNITTPVEEPKEPVPVGQNDVPKGV